jgi:glycolate oxidase FAD binding subunit
VTGDIAELAGAFGHLVVEQDDAMPPAAIVLAPGTAEEAARVLDVAAGAGRSVLMWGGGTHQGYGHRVEPDVILTTRRLDRIVSLQPDDLTVIVEAGVPVADLAGALAGHAQTAALDPNPGAATVGGAVAAAVSGWDRLRFGPIRDRVLEVVLATGDGRVVRGGAPLVKNVTGYDLSRLATGSFGALGLITRVALKLWPRGRLSATVAVEDAERAVATAYRPLAVIEENGSARVYLSGTTAEVDAQAAELAGTPVAGLRWPEPLTGASVVVARIPPPATREAVDRVPAGWRYQAAFGVGEVRMAGDDDPTDTLLSLRAWAGRLGGSAVIERAPREVYARVDPWGDPGPSLELQRRVKAAFDPLGVCNPGRLPGGL